MRLLLVTQGFPPRVGGVETLCRQLAEGFADRGDAVTVLAYGGRHTGEVVQRSPAGAAYTVLRLPSRGAEFQWSWHLLPALRRARFDVCHVHNLHSTVAPGVWAGRRRPYVLTAHYHGGGHTALARLLHHPYALVARRVVADAAAVTAVSVTEAALLRRTFAVDPLVIPNGVDPDPPGESPSGMPDGTPTIAVVSRLVPHKRVDAVIHTLPELAGYHLRVLGDGPEHGSLLELADRLAVRDRVEIITERLSDQAVRDTLRTAAVHVNLSEAESFSYTVLEALAAGTPVVANGASALAEWATRFPDAVLLGDPEQPGQVAAAVRKLTGSRITVDLGEYALPAILDRYRAVYERVAA
jgi:glycosyltransferase involved in cell wall biosynthesis